MISTADSCVYYMYMYIGWWVEHKNALYIIAQVVAVDGRKLCMQSAAARECGY